MEARSIQSASIPWEDAEGFPPGLRRKILRAGPDGKPRVALIKLEAGFEMEAHSHDLAENHYVLEGMYEAQGTEHAVGSYRYIPARASHGPVHSRSGAIILVTWET